MIRIPSTTIRLAAAAATLALLFGAVALRAAEAPKAGAAKPAAAAKGAGDPYLLGTDPVTGAALPPAAKQFVQSYEGQQLRFASEANWKTFQAAPDKYMPAVTRATIAKQTALYPLTTCLVSGEKLGSMGDPLNEVYRNRLVRFCCSGCPPTFAKDPAKYMKMLDEAVIKAQKAAYPVKECVVSDESLGSMGDPIEIVAGNRLVRLCCKGCVDKFEKDPAGYVAMVEKAAAKK